MRGSYTMTTRISHLSSMDAIHYECRVRLLLNPSGGIASGGERQHHLVWTVHPLQNEEDLRAQIQSDL